VTVSSIATTAIGRAKLRANTSAQCVIATKRGPSLEQDLWPDELGQPATTAESGRRVPPSMAASGP
jgi:hypothetical protein